MGDIVRRGTKDRPRFYLRFLDENGVRRQRVAKGAHNLAEARELLGAAELRVAQGQVGIAKPTAEQTERSAVTVGALVARFLGDVEGESSYAPPRIKSIKNYRRDARSVFKARVRQALLTRSAASITRSDVERLRDELTAANLAGASVVQTLAILSKLYNWSRREGLIDCANPVIGVERPRSDSSIDFLAAAEVGQLLGRVQAAAAVGVASWQALTLAPMVATALYCGLRKGELFGLRWSDIAFDAALLSVNRSYTLLPKSGKARHVPVHPSLLTILRAWKKLCPVTVDGLVFPVETYPAGWRARKPGPTDLRMGSRFDGVGLDDALTVAKCHGPADGKPWHMLRHSFASHAVMSGAPLYDVQRLLGHATPTMTQRYAHLSPDHLAGAVARLRFAAATPAGVDDLEEERRRRAAEGRSASVDT